MVTSKNGRDLIKKYEGLRTKAYRCAAGVLTIGYGHTKGVKEGMQITKAQAEAFLTQDLAVAEQAVNLYVKRYDLNQNEYDALVSFTFNCGAGNLHKLLNKGLRTKKQIADKMLSYNKAGGKVLSGLVKRRNDERALFLTAISTSYMALGVDYSHVFDPAYYAEHNSDVKAVCGNNAKSLFEHFLIFGMNERRQAKDDFDVTVYAMYNTDVADKCRTKIVKGKKEIDWPKMYEHYCVFGYKEGVDGKGRRAV